VLHSFGREDQLDVASVRRLVNALSRLLDPADALAAAAPAGLSFVESRQLGGAWLLDALWRQLGIDKIVRGMVSVHRVGDEVGTTPERCQPVVERRAEGESPYWPLSRPACVWFSFSVQIGVQ
jgi:hypothetical protein